MHDEFAAYFKKLMDRVNDAKTVQFRGVVADDWEPKLNDCHRNVDFWVDKHPETKAVRGWLLWRLDQNSDQWTIIAHSVVGEGDDFFDITPIDENTPRNSLLF
jgi:hypothetical protein